MRTLQVFAGIALLVVGGLSGCQKPAVPPARAALPAFEPPLNDAVVGEELVLKRGPTEWRYTVTEAGDVNVVVDVMRYEEGEPVGKSLERFRWHRNGFGVPDDAVVRKVERGRVDAGGQTWDCWILHVDTKDRGRFYYWITNEVAGHGIVKIAKDADEGVDDRHALRWAGDSASGRHPK